MRDTEAALANLLKRTSDLSATLLPLSGSLIAYNLLLSLYICHLRGETPTVKSLFASIPYSDMGIRYHLRKLLITGWIELRPSASDRRTKVCVPTDRFNQAWEVLMSEMKLQLDRHAIICEMQFDMKDRL